MNDSADYFQQLEKHHNHHQQYEEDTKESRGSDETTAQVSAFDGEHHQMASNNEDCEYDSRTISDNFGSSNSQGICQVIKTKSQARVMRVKDIEILRVQWTNNKLMQGHRSYHIRCSLATTLSPGGSSSPIQGLQTDQQFEVSRRFRDFHSLYAQLQNAFPGCIIPPLPDKSIKDKIVSDDSEFVDERKQGLLRFLKRVARHRVLGQSDEFVEFMRDEHFYHTDNGSSATQAVSKSLKSLWSQGRKAMANPIKGWISPGSKGSPISSNAFDILKLDPEIEGQYQTMVVDMAGVLEKQLYGLQTSLQAQVNLLVKRTQGLQRLRFLLFSDPATSCDEGEAVDCSNVYDINQSSNGFNGSAKSGNSIESEGDMLREFSEKSTDLCATYKDGFLADVNFYYRYILSLQASIDSRQNRISTLLETQTTSITRGSGLQLQQEAEKLRNSAKGLLCEYQELMQEIQVRVIGNIATLAVKYAEYQ